MWQVGTPTAGPGSCYNGSQCAGTILDGNYGAHTDSRLVSPTLQLPVVSGTEEVHLRFQQWFSYAGGDWGEVHISVWDAASGTWGNWANLGTVAANTSGWSQGDVDMTAYAGETVRVAFFHIASRPCCSSSNYESTGWYIDDITITSLTAPNHPPVLAALTDTSLDENTTLIIPLSATDPNAADVLVYSMTGPAFASLTDNGDGTGELVSSPGFADAGDYSVTVTVTDLGGLSHSQSFTLTVNDVPRAPSLAALGDQSLDEGATITIPLLATDPDSGDTLVLSLTGPAFVSLTDNGDGSGQLLVAPGFSDAGVYPGVTVTVTDGSGLSRSQSFTLTVNDAPLPVLAVTPASLDFGEVLVGTSASLTLAVSNTGGSTLSVSDVQASGAPFSVFPPASFEVAPGTTPHAVSVGFAPGAEGDFTGTITLLSNTGSPVAVTVTGRGVAAVEPGRIQTFAGIDFGTVEEGSAIDKVLTVTNTGAGPLSVSALSVDNGLFSAAPALGESLPFNLKPGEARNLVVRFAPPLGTAAGTSALGTLRIDSDDAVEPVRTVALVGKVGAATPDLQDNPVLGARVGTAGSFDVITASTCAGVGGEVSFGAGASGADTFVVTLVDQGGVRAASAVYPATDGAGTVAFDGIDACGLADGVIAVEVTLTRDGTDLPAMPGTPAVKNTTPLTAPVLDPLPMITAQDSVQVCGSARENTTVRISGGARVVSTALDAGTSTFCLDVPLRYNQQNTLIASAIDDLAPAPKPVASAAPVQIIHLDPSEVVFADVYSRPLSQGEIDDLVNKGVIDATDAANFNVSMFTVVLTIGSTPVTVSQPVVHKPGAGGVSYGLGSAWVGGGGSGGGGGGGGSGGAGGTPSGCVTGCAQLVVITDPEGHTIPGVIIIDGRIKTLKEFFQVTLLLSNRSSAFTLAGMNASVRVPAGLTPVRAGLGTDITDISLVDSVDSVALGDIGPGGVASGQFIVRGDGIGTHSLDVDFSGAITGGGLPTPVPVSGTAGTTVQVLGPPSLDVVVRHPSRVGAPDVIANEIYDLVVEITNTSSRPALYTSLELFVGGDARLVDVNGLPVATSSEDRAFGHIQPGETVSAGFRVQSLVEGEIIACQAIAAETITLTVDTGPDGTACNILGSYPASFQPLPADRPPTVLAVNPAPNQVDIPITTSVMAVFTPPVDASCLRADTWRNVVTAPIDPLDPSKGLQVVSADLQQAGTFYLEELDAGGDPLRHIPVDLTVEDPPAGGTTIAVLRLGLDAPHPNSQFFLKPNTRYRATIVGGPAGVCSAGSGATVAADYRWVFFTGAADANHPPVLDPLADLVMDEGGTQLVALTATDPDVGDSLTLSLSGPAFASLTDNGDGSGSLTLAPGFTAAGVYTITVTVTDADGLTDTRSFALQVGDVNRAPSLDPIGDQALAEGGRLSLALSATDPDAGDSLVLSVSAPAFVGLIDNGGGSGTLQANPGFADAGDYTVTVTATDATGLSNSQTFVLHVTNVNRPPLLVPIGARTVNEGETLSFLVSATDPDGDALSFALANAPTGATLSDNGDGTALFNWTPGFTQAGNFQPIISVTDSGVPMASDSEQVTLTVGDVNRPPLLAPIGARTVNEGETLSFLVSATDPDGDALSFALANAPTGATLVDNGDGTALFSWTPSFTQAGNFQPIISVTDSGVPMASDSEQVTLTVGDVNRPPVLAPIGARTVNEGETLSFLVSASDPDGDALSFALANAPTGATLSDNGDGTALFNWTPGFTQAGNFQPIISVTDNGEPMASDSEQVTLTVGDVNRPPVLAPIGDRSVREGELLTIHLTASDPDGDGLAFFVDGLPGGADFVDNGDGTAVLSWIPDFSQAGSHVLDITVGDDGQPPAEDAESVTITVGDSNRAPVLAPIGDRTVSAGETLTLQLSASDADGDALGFGVTDLPAGASLQDHGDGTATFSWTPDLSQLGSVSVGFDVTDSGIPPLSDSERITITVESSASGCNGGVAGDLDGDCDVDSDDFTLFNASFGQCSGATGYNAEADYDGDGCVTFVDYQTWYGYFLSAQGG